MAVASSELRAFRFKSPVPNQMPVNRELGIMNIHWPARYVIGNHELRMKNAHWREDLHNQLIRPSRLGHIEVKLRKPQAAVKQDHVTIQTGSLGLWI